MLDKAFKKTTDADKDKLIIHSEQGFYNQHTSWSTKLEANKIT